MVKTELTGADSIAVALEELGVEIVFAITGAGNLAICDAIASRGSTRLIFVHHEQAALMAAQGLTRTTGKLGVALVTTGGGSTNALTGIVGANMDSIPLILITGNESSVHTNTDNELRIWGVQGFDSKQVFAPVSKASHRVRSADSIYDTVINAALVAQQPRAGVVTIDVPMDLQRKPLSSNRSTSKTSTRHAALKSFHNADGVLEEGLNAAKNALNKAKRPVVLLGAGLKNNLTRKEIRKLITDLGIPTLLSWSAIDLLDSEHEMNFGRSGIYGDRFSNMIVQNSDLVISIGSRLAIPQLSYDANDFARHAEIVVVDIDIKELEKFVGERWTPVQADASEFLSGLVNLVETSTDLHIWIDKCREIRSSFPRRAQTVSAPPIGSSDKYVNSYDVVYEISDQAGDCDIFVTDMGTGLLAGFYGLDINGNQQLATSLGLGEMGYGLPAAIGSQFANPDSTVICLNADGGMMMNLQELQTVAHHKLPIKLVIFNNDGYLMIKNSQRNLFEGRYVGSNADSGISCPDFEKLSSVFGFEYVKIDGKSNLKNQVSTFLNTSGAVILEVFMDPEQLFIPRVGTLKAEGGALISPPLEDMIPLIDEAELRRVMDGNIHPQSIAVRQNGSLPSTGGQNS
jgi:acetolactate synthase-1/2/3 large subunit